MSRRSYKVIALGVQTVGKSATTLQFIHNHFEKKYDPTIEENYRQHVSIDGEEYNMKIVDLGGFCAEDYSLLIEYFARRNEGFILMYAISDLQSFDYLGHYYNRILSAKNGDPFPIIVVGNKCDLEKERQVETARGQELADEINCPFFEISAKERINIDECFHTLLVNMRNSRIEKRNARNQRRRIK